VQSEYEIDTVFHLAAQTIVGCANQDPVGTFKANIEGTWNVLEAARQNPRLKAVIIASSDKAYGNLHGNAYDESFPLHGDHPYDVSKSCADLISQTYAKTYGLPVAITRCGNFFGPGDLNYSRIIPGIIRDVMLERRPLIRSDGKAIRDYIYVGDGVHAYMTLAEALLDPNKGKSLVGQAFNFSYGLRLSVLDVVNSILKTMERTDLKPEILNQAKNEIPEQSLDSKKAKELLNWSQRFGFEEGLKNTVAWYRQEVLDTGKVIS
jgi:CDP-glucose 4,6-dehydratase